MTQLTADPTTKTTDGGVPNDALHDTAFATTATSLSKATIDYTFPLITSSAKTLNGVYANSAFTQTDLNYSVYFSSSYDHPLEVTYQDSVRMFGLAPSPGTGFGLFGYAQFFEWAPSGPVNLTPSETYNVSQNASTDPGQDPVQYERIIDNIYHFTLQTNRNYSVHLYAIASAGGYMYATGTTTAFMGIDPQITFSSLTNPDVTLVLSPGVGNSTGAFAGVPEPSAWVMMVSGFALAGGTLRRVTYKRRLSVV